MMLPVRRIHNMRRLLRLFIQCHTKINPLSTSCMQRIILAPVDNTFIHCNSYHSLFLHEDSRLLTIRCAAKSLPQARSKAKKTNKKSEATESESEEESESESDLEGEEEEIESELDYDSPMVHKDLEINTLRADGVAAKSLKYSKSDADQFFYESKFLLNGKKLLKKGTKLSPGDILDLVVDHSEAKISVKRVKVIKVKGVSKKGNDIVHVRAWRDPFEIDPPENYQSGRGDSAAQE